MAYTFRNFYIDGRWVAPLQPRDFEVINPATEEVAGVISLGNGADADRAVAAARLIMDRPRHERIARELLQIEQRAGVEIVQGRGGHAEQSSVFRFRRHRILGS